jgi:hypothetical protein
MDDRAGLRLERRGERRGQLPPQRGNLLASLVTAASRLASHLLAQAAIESLRQRGALI